MYNNYKLHVQYRGTQYKVPSESIGKNRLSITLSKVPELM